jgi:hypothetical protein
MKQHRYKIEESELYVKSTANWTAIARATAYNPQNITSSVYLYTEISRGEPKRVFEEIVEVRKREVNRYLFIYIYIYIYIYIIGFVL